MAETVVFEVDLTKTLEQLTAYQKNIDTLKAKQKELRAEALAGNEDAAKAYQKVTVELKVQGDQYKATQRTLEGYTAAQKEEIDTVNFANNSLKQNKDLYKQLQSQYERLKNPTAEATAKLKSLNDTLKAQESAYGQNARSVGSYREEIKKAFTELNIAGVNIGKAGESISGLKNNFKDAGGGAAGLSAAFAGLLPIAAPAIGGIVSAFLSYKPVADAVEDITAKIGATFRALVTGGDVSEMTRIYQAQIDTLRDLEDSELSYQLAIQETNNDLNKLLLLSRNRKFSDDERLQFLKEAATLEKSLLAQELERVDRAIKSDEDAIASKGKLTEKQKLLFREGSEEQKLEIRAILDKRSVDEEEIKRYQGNLVKRAKLQSDSVSLREKISIREGQILDQIQAEQDKAAEKENQRLEKLRQEREKYEQEIQRLRDEFLLDERQKLEKSFDDKLAIIKGNGPKEVELRLAIEQEKQFALDKFDADAEKKREAKRIQGITDEYNAFVEHNNALQQLELDSAEISIKDTEALNKKKLEIQLKYLELNLAATRAFYTTDGELSQQELDKLALLESAIKKLKAAIAGGGGEVKTETFAEALGIDTETLSDVILTAQLLGQTLGEITNAINAQYENRRRAVDETLQTELDAIDELNTNEADKERRRKNAEKQAAKAAYQIELEQFKANKAISITQTIINTAQAVMSAIATAGNIYSGIALSVAAAATGALQLGVIAAQQPPPPPKFATGVIGLQGAGTETSDSIPAYLSKGESVITAKATRRFAPVLAQMEMAVGNDPNYQFGSGHFATGFIPQGDGGFFTRSASESATAITKNDLRQLLSDMPAPVVSVKEVTRVSSNLNKAVKVSEL